MHKTPPPPTPESTTVGNPVEDRPTHCPPPSADVPPELRAERRWVTWKLETPPGRTGVTKVPYRADGRGRASVADPTTLGTYTDAATTVATRDGFAGVGFVLGDGFAGVDLDDCRGDAGTLIWGDDVLTDLAGTYAEWSPSGTGVKVFGRGTKPANCRSAVHKIGPEGDGALEAYDAGRWFAFTGERVDGHPLAVADITAPLADVCRRYELIRPTTPPPPPSAVATAKAVRPASGDDAPTAVERCRKYLVTVPASVAGQGGHDALLRAACECVRFDLGDADAMTLLREYNARAVPEWSEAELRYKLAAADKVAGADRGKHLRADRRPGTSRRNGVAAKGGRAEPTGDEYPAADDVDAPDPTVADDPAGDPVGDVAPAAPTRLPAIRSAVDLMAAYPTQRPAIIHGLIRVGETLNIISGPKTFKSHTVASLLIAAATGGRWLDTYQVERGRVLLVDNELYPDTIAARMRAVTAGMGLSPADLADRFDVVTLRGDLRNVHQLGELFRSIDPGRYSLIALDAIYRMLPDDEGAENSNSVWAGIYNAIDRHAMRLGCGFVMVHHTSKGAQGDKAITDVGAGGGAMSRAADCHLVLRRHEEDEAVVIEAEVRTFPKPPPLCCRWGYPLWHPDGTLDPSHLLRERGRGGRPRGVDAKPAKPDPIVWTADTFATAFVTAEPKSKEVIVAKGVAAGMTGRQCGQMVALALDDRRIHKHAKPPPDHRTVYLATVEQELFARDSHTRTPPHTPRGKRRKSRRPPGN